MPTLEEQVELIIRQRTVSPTAIKSYFSSTPDKTFVETLIQIVARLKASPTQEREITERALTAALAIDPTNVHAQYHLGTIRLMQKNYTVAEQLLRNVVQISPRHSWGLYQLARVEEAQGHLTSAQDYYRRAAELNHVEAKKRVREPQYVSRGINDYTPLEQRLKEAERTTFRNEKWQTEPVSIIIPTYQKREALRKTLLGLVQQTYDLSKVEVIIADDGSTDGTKEMVESMHLPFQLRYIRQENRGYRVAKNRNNALRIASYGYIILLDGDMLPTPQLVETHMRWHKITEDAREDVMLIGRRQYVQPDTLTDKIISERRLDTVPRALHQRTGSLIDWRESKFYEPTDYLKDLSRYQDPFYVLSSMVCSGNISFTKARAFAAGLFDETFTRWGKEDKLFGDAFLYSQKMFPDRPVYFIPLMDALALHQEHEFNSSTRQIEIMETDRHYKARLKSLKSQQFFPAPKVSVYIPAWNTEKFTEQAIESVRQQTFKDVEVCVAEDHSDDQTYALLERLTQKYNTPGQRPFLRIERNEQNNGIGPTSNRAVRMCRGEYILQLDSDDYLVPHAISTLASFLDTNRKVGLVFGDCTDILPDDTTKPHWSPNEFTTEHIAKKGYQESLRMLWDVGMRVTHPRMFRREAFYRTEGFAEDIVNAIDYDMFMKLSEVTEVRHIREPLYYYRTNHGNNTSVAKKDMQIRNAQRVMERGKARRAHSEHFKFYNVEPQDSKQFISDKTWAVSVYMPLALKNVQYLEESLDSILSQTLSNVGVCIGVDDTPENAHAFLALINGKYKTYFDPQNKDYGKIKFTFTGKTGGSGGAAPASNVAMNIALDSNKSRYVLHLDPDDRYCSTSAIESLVQFIEADPTCALAYADANTIDNTGRIVSKGRDTGEFSRQRLWNKTRPYNQVGHPRVYDANVLRTLRQNEKLFDESLSVSVDLDLILRVDKYAHEHGMEIRHYESKPGGFSTIFPFIRETVLADYRVHSNSISATSASLQYQTYKALIEKHTSSHTTSRSLHSIKEQPQPGITA
ncbi:MAG: glycosyltransferase [Candidatus Woesearchaeota archaeon]